MIENFKGSLMETPWDKYGATKVIQGSWKELDAWVYGYCATNPGRYIWRLIKSDPLNSQAIQKLAKDGWKVFLTNMSPGSGSCSEKNKKIEISAQAEGYARDEPLFHELVHAQYSGELSDGLGYRGYDGDENTAITEWLARIYRSDHKLLRTAIEVFNLTPYIYDKPSYLAFAENPIDFKKQYILPWGIKTKIRFSSVFMHCV